MDRVPTRRRLRRRYGLLLFVAWASACMSPEEAKTEADQESYGIIAKARDFAGQHPDASFSIEPESARDRYRFVLPPEDDSHPGPKERLAKRGESVKLTVADVLAIAARNSREYQDEKENLYNAALRLTSVANTYEMKYFGTIGGAASSRGDGDNSATPSLTENSSFGFTRVLSSGGQVALSIGQNLTRFLANPASSAASSLVNLTVTLPILRGAGEEIAYENVTQAERDVIYAVRRFERFKRQFAVDITSQYMRLLQSANTIENEKANYAALQATASENRALGEAGRIARTDVERANQSELAGEVRLIRAKQQHANDKDQFLISLGLPPDAYFEVDPADVERLLNEGVQSQDYVEDALLTYALGSRLDLASSREQVADARRKIIVAADALDAQLDFTGSANLVTSDYAKRSFRLDPIANGSYSAGLDLDLPFERTAERNTYRTSLINLEGARRTYEETEDSVKAAVRRALRNMMLAKETYRIQVAALKVAETNVDAAMLLKDAGTGSTNDLLDAQNDLVSAKNAVTASVIDFLISRMQLFRDLDVLVTDDRGIDYATTLRLLEEQKP